MTSIPPPLPCPLQENLALTRNLASLQVRMTRLLQEKEARIQALEQALQAREAELASLRAADQVICQTGCVSHADFWRDDDHCRRHARPCDYPADAMAGNVLTGVEADNDQKV